MRSGRRTEAEIIPRQDWRPDFIVIGAVKAATTWIQARLMDNPAIYMPLPEPHFFSSRFELGEAHYRSFFAGRPACARLVGEKSADYLAHPQAPSRMAGMLPGVRLVLQLRDPVERAYSDYKMFYRRGTINGPPEQYLSSLASEHPRFLYDGLYARHVSRWLDHFPRESLLAFLYENLGRAPQDIVASTSRHIGIEPLLPLNGTNTRKNSSSAAILPLGLRRALSPFKQAVRPLRGNPVFEGARALFAREITYPPLSPDLRARLRDFYAEDVAALESLLDIDLSCWQVPTGTPHVLSMTSAGTPNA